jgi:hypothetical protein
MLRQEHIKYDPESFELIGKYRFMMASGLFANNEDIPQLIIQVVNNVLGGQQLSVIMILSPLSSLMSVLFASYNLAFNTWRIQHFSACEMAFAKSKGSEKDRIQAEGFQEHIICCTVEQIVYSCLLAVFFMSMMVIVYWQN